MSEVLRQAEQQLHPPQSIGEIVDLYARHQIDGGQAIGYYNMLHGSHRTLTPRELIELYRHARRALDIGTTATSDVSDLQEIPTHSSSAA